VPADLDGSAVLTVTGAVKVYRPRRRGETLTKALDGVSFALGRGSALGLVGASGSGKSTLARLVTGLERPTSGEIWFGGTRVDRLRRGGLRRLRKHVQMVFQDPYAALNPLHTVGYTLSRPIINYLGLNDSAARAKVRELLVTTGLAPAEQFEDKLPHQLSGGQRQRVVIAHALASDPDVIIADEPVSMLDVSLRAGVLQLLGQLRAQRGVSLLYITHDLLSARAVTSQVLVLNQGRVVERGATAEVLRHPRDPYTQRLLAALPNPFAAASAAASVTGEHAAAAPAIPQQSSTRNPR
jgi:peptide/nickel transport system ATP-binding protein